MKQNYLIVLLAGIMLLFFFSASSQSETPLFEKDGLKISEMKGSPNFPSAVPKLKSPLDGALLEEGKNTFKFEVENYRLGAQTPDADQNLCANSSKGQHIHFILDNEPYMASYNPEIISDMSPGHHVVLAFLSRSYHESIKTRNAFVLKEFDVPVTDTLPGTKLSAKDYSDKFSLFKDFDEKAPHLFFSRPKGQYVDEKETKKVMLDFYLVNCTLSPDGYKVRATVDGNEFIITKWAPYIIEGLKLGERKVKLELIDKDNTPVKSPFNGVERKIFLTMEMKITPVEEKK